MLYCKDCKFCELIPTVDNVDYSKCHHPLTHVDVALSPVTGLATKPLLRYCEYERKLDDRCGITAKRFLPNILYAENLRDLTISSREEERRWRAQSRYRDEGQQFESEAGAKE